ncbi:hypothetical protein L6164_030084 [Bauhinia variegata]|uniref:Uncharacterized protein n=1 Tax=Bauhinia variegata TaxID=167791 RepID=A0ACB9LBC5_BAUVA|nr:hypothetical protein L6164_030084 [Bauhinia variegata]
MASSAHKQPLLSNLYGGATSAPPPTPSTHPNSLLSTSDAADALSRLLHRMPPTLSPVTRRSSSPATCPPVVSLSESPNDNLVSEVSGLGYFQVTDHSVPSQLANSAESESLALFDLTRDQKESYFPKNWPLGYEGGDDEEGDGLDESFCLDSSCSTESGTELSLASLRELTRELEKLGLKVIQLLSKATGFENPVADDPTRFCSLMWISEGQPSSKPAMSGGFYPFIVGLQCQIRCQKHSLLSDSGWVSVLPHVDAILVTIGDIAQVWSNGKLKKVRGSRAVANVGEKKESAEARCITMSLLLTLPAEATVGPLLPGEIVSKNEEEDEEEENKNGEGEKKMFKSFSFEDYAWRVYHERLLFRDPLDRYRIVTT